MLGVIAAVVTFFSVSYLWSFIDSNPDEDFYS